MRLKPSTLMSSTVLLLTIPAVFAGSSGTLLSGTKTAQATITATENYDWSVDKQCPSTTTYSVPFGTSVTIPFTIVATRNGPTSSSITSPITGQVCLKNEGILAATRGLYGTDQLEQFDGTDWVPLGTSITLAISDELDPLETRCYDYQLSGIPLTANGLYRNHAVASIDNFQGYEGTEHSIDVFSPVTITQRTDVIDENANLIDRFQCPAGFTCDWHGPNLTLSGSRTITYAVILTNNSAACAANVKYLNTAALTTGDTHARLEDRCELTLTTEECGCTGTIGYWRNHPELIAPVLPLYLGTAGGAKTLAVTTTTIAVNVISQNVYGSPSNGITKLYAQLLGARIAIARGASPSKVASTLALADAFLATHNHLDWTALTAAEQAMVIGWASIFENFNSGQIPGAPEHC